MNGVAESLKADAKSRVDEARAAVEKASKQGPTAPAGDGAAASSSE